MPVKQAGLALTDCTKTAPENWTVSCDITGHLVAVIRFHEEFRTADHSTYLSKRRVEVCKRSILRED